MITLEKEYYANVQKVFEFKNNELIYYYRDGTLKAKGPYLYDIKQALWQYFRK